MSILYCLDRPKILLIRTQYLSHAGNMVCIIYSLLILWTFSFQCNVSFHQRHGKLISLSLTGRKIPQTNRKVPNNLKSKLDDDTDDGFLPNESIRSKSGKDFENLPTEVDYVVIGSGIGGLSAAAMLAWYGYSVVVCESHYRPGGVAHSFERQGYKFDAGPSLWNGMSTKPYNPLREILEITGQGNSVKYAQYDGWMMSVPEGSFKFTVGKDKFEPILQRFGGPNALSEWKELLKILQPIQKLATAIPPLVLRDDAYQIFTLLPYFSSLLAGAPYAGKVQGPFKEISKHVVKDKFLENWLEFLSFALSGKPADATIAAAVAYTMRDLHQERAALDYPLGGSGAIIDALIRAIESPLNKNAPSSSSNRNQRRINKVYLNTQVEEIIVDQNEFRAQGVKVCSSVLKNKGSSKVIKAKRAVISNASIWDTMRLLSAHVVTANEPHGSDNKFVKKLQEYKREKMQTPKTNSFVHLHLGFDGTGLSSPLETHYSMINRWDPIDAPQNHVIASVPSVLDRSLAPADRHVLHAYAAANEPYEVWEEFRNEYRRSISSISAAKVVASDGSEGAVELAKDEGLSDHVRLCQQDPAYRKAYADFKETRCAFLYQSVEKFIPDIKERSTVKLLASPFTHERFNRRYRGTYGPSTYSPTSPKQPITLYPKTPIQGLLLCGDSTFPGIGVPAVAASGAHAAATTVSLGEHMAMLHELSALRATY